MLSGIGFVHIAGLPHASKDTACSAMSGAASWAACLLKESERLQQLSQDKKAADCWWQERCQQTRIQAVTTMAHGTHRDAKRLLCASRPSRLQERRPRLLRWQERVLSRYHPRHRRHWWPPPAVTTPTLLRAPHFPARGRASSSRPVPSASGTTARGPPPPLEGPPPPHMVPFFPISIF